MPLTLNQVQDRLKSLALSHHQVNSYYFGDPWEFDANGDIDFPAVFVTLLPGYFNRDQRQQRYNARIYFLDQVQVSEDSEGNETDVISDMHSIASDYLAMLNYTGYQDDWDIDSNVTAEPRTEQINDLAAGVSIDVGINVDFLADRCQVPAEDITFESDFDMARTKLLTYTGTGLEGDSFTVPDLAGTVVLAVYRAGNYKRPIDSVPTDSDKIGVVGTANTQGVSASTGVAKLQSGDALVAGEILDFLIWSI